MAKKKINTDNDPFLPIDFPENPPCDRKVPMLKRPIWTHNKANLIQNYLRLFVFITKHGTYIDGFAGPQEPANPEMWSAKLVLETDPKWLKHFHLIDKRKIQVDRLHELAEKHPTEIIIGGRKHKRTIEVYKNDSNIQIIQILRSNSIRQKEATFCLLDQRTFQCHWSTLQELAAYKRDGENKIELFYFLAVGWLKRALAAVRNYEILEKWWGRDDYLSLCKMSIHQQKMAFVNRIKEEFGYKSVLPYAIHDRKNGGRIMYYLNPRIRIKRN